MMEDYCCPKMESEVREIRDQKFKDHSVVYDKRYREFFIHFYEEAERRDRKLLTHINYCSWCGIKLPSRLDDKWWEILEKEYGIESPSDYENDKVPDEFWTDEWWKKRNL